MRLGSLSPNEERLPRDLGRFGLGLKTASFSQCRRLTVATKSTGKDIIARCWDLDVVSETGEWRLLKIQKDNLGNEFTDLTGIDSGTIILWEKIDRLVKNVRQDDEKAHNLFDERVETVCKYLSMIFHRYLSKKDALNISINGTSLEPWDPFLENLTSTQKLPQYIYHHKNGNIVIKSYILPHHTMINDRTYKYAEGPKGWNDQQGFYIYRNERLIVAGSWLNLGFAKEEPFKLARICIDIPNSLDSDWELDVKKSVARPPSYIREKLKGLAKDVRERSAKVYYTRAKVVERKEDKGFDFVWKENIATNHIKYTINRNHPLVKNVLNTGNNKEKIASLLMLVEETIPIELILLRNVEQPDKKHLPFDHESDDVILKEMSIIFDSLASNGIEPTSLKELIAGIEPFNCYPGLYKKFIKMKGL
jgi:hypothetical protein